MTAILTFIPVVAKTCVVIFVFLLAKGLRKRRTYERRYGWKTWAFLAFTFGLIVAPRFFPKPNMKQSIANVQAVNASLISAEGAVKNNEVSLEQGYQEYVKSFANFSEAHDLKSDLRVVGTLAGQTAELGHSVLRTFHAMELAGRNYESTFSKAEATYSQAQSAINFWASEERAYLNAVVSLRSAADQEAYRDLINGYKDLAETLEMAAKSRRTSVSHISMSLEELKETMKYIESANRFLETVQQHCLTLADWKSPETILAEIKTYQDGVMSVGKAITTLRDRLAVDKQSKTKEAETATKP